MDVRAADTSTLAVQRLEMEGIKPVTEKRGFMQSEEYADRVKAQKEHKKGHGQDNHGGAQEEIEETNSEQVLDTKVVGLSEDDHVLDVKV